MKFEISKIFLNQDREEIELLFDDVYPDNYYMQQNLRCLFKGEFINFEKYSLKACVGQEIVAVLIGDSCDIFFELEEAYGLKVEGFDNLRDKPSFKSYALMVKSEYRNRGIIKTLLKRVKRRENKKKLFINIGF